MTDWNPETYARFRGLRLRPAADLLAQVGYIPQGDIIDLGCGDGAALPLLRATFAQRRVLGVDNAPPMLAAAQGYDAQILADIATWAPTHAPALIFSNAALQWLGGHRALLRRLAGFLMPGGTLAVQMPRQYEAPSHGLLRALAVQMFPDRFEKAAFSPPVAAPLAYAEMLAGLGVLNLWETEYMQPLPAESDMHPVRAFTQSTAMRPFAAKLSAPEHSDFCAAYDMALASAYPLRQDGGVLMPFRRLFFTVKV